LAVPLPLPLPGDAPRILIVRLSALGDLVFTTALLDTLRRRWPGAWIGWLASERFAGLLRDDPRLDAVIPAPATLGSWAAIAALRSHLKPLRVDWVIDAQGLLKSRLVARLVPGARRIGFASKEPLGFLMDALLPKGGDVADIASEYRDLAQRLTGLEASAPRLLPTDASRSAVAEALHAHGLSAPAGYVALCPFTTRPQKHWFEEHWVALAERLHAAGVGPLAILGGPAEREAAQRLVAACPAGSVNLAGETRLADLPAWLEAARLVIGVDTGLTHIGIATGRPTLALFGSTRPYTRGVETPMRVLYEDLACAPCKRKPSCEGRYDCMRALTPERVAQAALKLMAASVA